MKFEMNCSEYEIVEVGQDEFYKTDQERKEDVFFWGQTRFSDFKVLLYKDLPIGQKKKTLYHELMHVYVRAFGTDEISDNISEEILCDISSNSHDIIHKIVEEYFRK